MSSGAPRNFINVIKEAFDYEYQREHKVPFKDNNKISVKSQIKAIYRVSEWFFNTNRIPYNEQDKINPLYFLGEIGDFLRQLRFANVPPECSLNLFVIEESFYIQHEILFNKLLDYSFIIESADRRDKNSSKKGHTFFINGTVIPNFDLAVSKRGVLSLNTVILNAIIEKKAEVINAKIQEYNAPFVISKPTLFENGN